MRKLPLSRRNDRLCENLVLPSVRPNPLSFLLLSLETPPQHTHTNDYYATQKLSVLPPTDCLYHCRCPPTASSTPVARTSSAFAEHPDGGRASSSFGNGSASDRCKTDLGGNTSYSQEMSAFHHSEAAGRIRQQFEALVRTRPTEGHLALQPSHSPSFPSLGRIEQLPGSKPQVSSKSWLCRTLSPNLAKSTQHEDDRQTRTDDRSVCELAVAVDHQSTVGSRPAGSMQQNGSEIHTVRSSDGREERLENLAKRKGISQEEEEVEGRSSEIAPSSVAEESLADTAPSLQRSTEWRTSSDGREDHRNDSMACSDGARSALEPSIRRLSSGKRRRCSGMTRELANLLSSGRSTLTSNTIGSIPLYDMNTKLKASSIPVAALLAIHSAQKDEPVEEQAVEVTRFGRPRVKPMAWWSSERLVGADGVAGFKDGAAATAPVGIDRGSVMGDLLFSVPFGRDSQYLHRRVARNSTRNARPISQRLGKKRIIGGKRLRKRRKHSIRTTTTKDGMEQMGHGGSTRRCCHQEFLVKGILLRTRLLR